MNISACLVVLDFLPEEDVYGLGIISIKDWNRDTHRSLFYIGTTEGMVRFEIGFFIIKQGAF